MKATHRLVVHAEKALSGTLLCHLVLQVPDAVLVRELLVRCAALRQDAALEPTHVEEEVRVVFGVDGDETSFPHDGRDGAREAVLDVPEDSPTEVYVVLHEAHAGVARPALAVVVADDVLVVGVRVLCEVTLDEVTGLLRCEPVREGGREEGGREGGREGRKLKDMRGK